MLRIRLALELKRFLDENEIDIFQTSEIFKRFPSVDKRLLEKVIQEVTDLEYTKIEKGKYCRSIFKNEYVIGNFLTEDAVIAYWSALNIHGLTEQFPNKVFVQTTKNKANKEVFGTDYQFIKVAPKKMTGVVTVGTGTNKFRITDIEKTIFDCFDLVNYSGGFMELIRALKRTKLDTKKMTVYAAAIGNKAATKRIAYLAELFGKKELSSFIKIAKKQKSKNYDLFDIYGDNEGKYNSVWNLRLNIEENDLIEIANSIY